MTDRLKQFETRGNLIAPIRLPEGEYQVFIRDHRCALCAGCLDARHVEDREWEIYCLDCGPAYEHTVISIYKADMVLVNRRVTPEPGPPRPAEVILKELGFYTRRARHDEDHSNYPV